MTWSSPPAEIGGQYTRKQLAILAGITLLAAALRLYRLGEWSFWVDEAHTYRDVVGSSELFWDNKSSLYPLSFLLLRGLVDLGMPTTEAAMRLPFVFFGILSVPALGLVGRNMVGAPAALLASLLLAVSPWHIYWSQNARSYSMVLFFVLGATGTFYNGVRRRSGGLLGLALALTVIAGLCHPSAYLLLAAYLVYGVLEGRRSGRSGPAVQRWLPLAVLGLLVLLTWALLPLIQHVMRVKPSFSLFHLVQTMAFFARVPLLVAALGGLLLVFDRGDPAALFLGAWMAVPLLALAVVAAVTQVTAQYAFYTLPAICLLGAAVVLALAERIETRGFRGHLLRAVPAGLLLLDMSAHTYLYMQRYHGERPRWREAALYLMRPHDTDHPVTTVVLTTNQPSMSYYLNQRDFVPGLASNRYHVVGMADYKFAKAGGSQQFMRQEVARARARGQELFVVVTEPELEQMDPADGVDLYVRSYFQQVRRLPNWTGPKDMTVLIYRMPLR